MDFQENIIKLYDMEVDNIWIHVVDEGVDDELYLDSNYLYFEVNQKFLKIFNILGEGKIRVTLEEKMEYSSEIYEGDVFHKINLSDFILNVPEMHYYVEKIGGINVVIKSNEITCDAIEIDLYAENKAKQKIFIHAGICGVGLGIGGMDKKSELMEELYVPLYGDKIDERWF